MTRRSLFLMILLAAALLAAVFQAACNRSESACQEPAVPKPSVPVLLISIDGFMPEYLYRIDTPNLDRLAKKGVLAESMISVFPTKTFPTHYSIATGLYVENHGIISNHFYDAGFKKRFSFGPPDRDAGESSGNASDDSENGTDGNGNGSDDSGGATDGHKNSDDGKDSGTYETDDSLRDSENGADDEIWWGGEPIWVTAEKQGKTAVTMFWPGSDSEIDGVRPTRYKEYDGTFSNHARIDTVISWLDPAGGVQADFGTLYFSDVDVTAHRYGPNSAEVDKAVVEADEWIGYLLDRMEETDLTGRLDLIILSDHGMAELSEERLVFLDDLIDLDRVLVIDRTPVAMIQPEDGRTAEVYTRLKEAEKNYRVYLKEKMPEIYRFRDHPRIPEIIVIADSGYMITTREVFAASGIPAGMHGYDHRLPEMHAFFLANGPSFRRDLTIDPFQSIHLYELMCRLLEIEPAPNDGSLDSLNHIFP